MRLPKCAHASGAQRSRSEGARRKHREVREWYEALMKASPVGFFHTDADGLYIHANDQMSHILGMPQGDLIGLNWIQALHPGDRCRVIDEWIRCLESRITFKMEYRFVRKGGEVIWVLGQAVPYRGACGRVLSYVGTLTDITERRNMEEELRRADQELVETNRLLLIAKEKAESASLAKGRFLAMMSHEIRTPLNAVIGMTSLLRDTPLNEKQRESVEIIRHGGETLLALINDILDFSKIEAGKLDLEELPFSLVTCIEEALDLIAPGALRKELDLSYKIASSVPRVLSGDITRLRQILMNLLGNAVKFTEKGEVTLSVSCGGRIGEMHEIHFSVKDTGLGIPGDKVGLIFQPFSQIDASMSRTHAGTGLGLAICRRLVTLMQGRIWVESTPGCGSTFHFTILMRDAGTLPIVCKGDSPGGKEDSCRRKNLRILVAEDNALNQKILQSLLERLGCSADVAASGYEVLEALRRQPYDVVLMDVQMPEMDGIEATRAIRGTFPADMQPAIVAVTAAAFREDRDRCLEAGMDLCLTKPIDLETLRSILERLAASAQPPERLEGPPPLNSARLDELRSLLDDESGLRRLIDLFLKEAGALLGELKEVLAARDVTRACRLAHTLRSSCLNIGADRLAELSLDLEKKIRDADSSLAAAAMEAFVEEHIRVEKAFSSDAF